ncbi:predicted protein [Aspergillus terreus NIH2624]|uniref:Uncharacterized protein n=1 Tax=Aspergillus terreus (strain NIH 2624 / FGSC A1156) TaxID=341663 RepID=Q0CB35_ASPTN|nr:uncharacterized protein ATEG_09099 [Aspergillus terreus NIH2624]EAU30236.1 predicted protein [Aspergillus terreus NIH2624]
MAIAASIGLVSEAIHRHKTQAAATENEAPRSSPTDEQWALDEIQDELRQDSSSDSESEDQPIKKKIRNPARLADDFLQRYPPPSPESAPQGRLPLPVIIPQRRPGVRNRGFVRAYAPDLQACGIDQETFMDFLVTFTRASRPPQWMAATNLTAAAAFALPGHAMGAGVGFAIQVVNAIAMEMKGRVQANSFLQKLNQGFFQPRGLYCLVLSFDNTYEEAMTDESLATAIATSTDPKTGLRKYTDKLRTHSGTTGPAQFPESAPLVFPMLDWMENNVDATQTEKLGRYTKFRKFVADYYDRRAQAEYAARNPESPLAMQPKRAFTSKFADPNHDTNKSPISLATGGAVPYNTTWRKDLRDREGGRRQRKIADKVLYMIIVNMPSEDDMSRAESIMATEIGAEPSVQPGDATATVE